MPLKAGPLGVDSVISVMYVGHEELKPPLRNPYSAPVGSRPPHFAEWSDGVATAENFKMFIVTRLDGPSAEIARGLVDKALAGESGLGPKSGVAYFDHQGTRQPSEWQYAVDNEIKSAAELSRKQGFQTVLHVQKDAPCGAMLTAATQYSYDPARKLVLVETPGSTIGPGFRLPVAGGGGIASWGRVQQRSEYGEHDHAQARRLQREELCAAGLSVRAVSGMG